MSFYTYILSHPYLQKKNYKTEQKRRKKLEKNLKNVEKTKKKITKPKNLKKKNNKTHLKLTKQST